MAPRKPGKAPRYLPTAPVVPVVRLTKQEVARRQLETAIDLLLTDGDLIAIHVLSSAAHDVIEGVARKRKILTGFEANVLRYPKHLRDAYRATIKRPFNFMKHGGGDDELADFVPETVNLHLVLAHGSYCHIYGEDVRNGQALMDWWKAYEATLPGQDVAKKGPIVAAFPK